MNLVLIISVNMYPFTVLKTVTVFVCMVLANPGLLELKTKRVASTLWKKCENYTLSVPLAADKSDCQLKPCCAPLKSWLIKLRCVSQGWRVLNDHVLTVIMMGIKLNPPRENQKLWVVTLKLSSQKNKWHLWQRSTAETDRNWNKLARRLLCDTSTTVPTPTHPTLTLNQSYSKLNIKPMIHCIWALILERSTS